jgi:hypothetical protein
MSLDKLLELEERRAFEATHRYEDLEFFHVPFDELTERSDTEAVLRHMAETGGRVALIGPSGCGKSSVIASVLGPLVEDLPERIIPLRIPVAAADETTVTEPRAFAQHVVRTVVRYASPETLTRAEQEALEAGVADARRRRGRERTGRLSLGAPRQIADAGIAAELKSGGEEIEQRLGAGDVVPELSRMIAIFRAHDREPFLVIDDSDTWLRVGTTDFTHVANAFFTRVVRMLAKELDSGIVIAVHDHYLELDGYREARELLSTDIRIPHLDRPEAAVGRILARRIELAEVDVDLAEAFQPESVAQLAGVYESGRNLRRVLATVDRSVQHACSDGVAPVTPALVRTALAELA